MGQLVHQDANSQQQMLGEWKQVKKYEKMGH